MLSAYPACFIKESNGYSVIFPDLNYLATCGDTLDKALAMAVDCLAGYLYWLHKDGEAAPSASPIDKIDPVEVAEDLEISPKESFVNIITVDVEEYAKVHFEKSVKKTLTIPAWLNTAALEQNINFSQVLQEALLAKIRT
ncbi:MAG: type II toxin-antitoxin system HicB family antitoxin [Butyrivibrio sp.]|nr:type II toxin-antitoxin system HicB family antitoxin [Muribaculum sp.]MCM1553779.1 type II toxin-antitoxin system HicB family antitoxin [Butyrivibrio sp.]